MRDMDLRYSLRAVDLPAVVVLGRCSAMARVSELGTRRSLPLERPDEVAEVIRRVAS
jgi:hypothetical protein